MAGPQPHYDAIVVGSGLGGAFAAHALVHAGCSVLMIERGDWFERGPHNWDADGTLERTSCYVDVGWRMEGERNGPVRAVHCVGGQSVFYGGVSLRLREKDFERGEAGDGRGFPFGYEELEPWYDEAERILGVTPSTGDPLAPARSLPMTSTLSPLSTPSERIAAAAGRLGLQPFRLPLAIHQGGNGRQGCVQCLTCDTFGCAVGAKNDTATAVLPPLLERGLHLAARTAAVRLLVRGDRVTGIECVDAATGRKETYQADHFVIAAGALASAQLLLASGLHARNPAGSLIGRYLARHCNGIVFGMFPQSPNPGGQFHKQIGIHDYYFGDTARRAPAGRLGAIQQVHAPPLGLTQHYAPRFVRPLLPSILSRTTGLLVIAHEEPRRENRLMLDDRRTDAVGLPSLVIQHSYSNKDRRARRYLARRAWVTWLHRIHTFSHAMGTVRMGDDPRHSPLDAECRFRGIANLSVTDASALPAGGAVNPSLTIAANALRAAHTVARGQSVV
jgi:choline dehydrogenase-like flavoprotein